MIERTCRRVDGENDTAGRAREATGRCIQTIVRALASPDGQSDIPGDISPISSIPSLYDCSQHVHVALGAGGDGPPTPPVKYILPTPYAMASAKTWIAPGDCVRHALQRWVLAAQERGQRTLRSTGRPSTSGRRWLQPPGVNQTDSAPWRHPRRCAIGPSTILAANESPI